MVLVGDMFLMILITYIDSNTCRNIVFSYCEQLIHSLLYKKREKGIHQVFQLQNQLFPNWYELQTIHSLQKYVDAYHSSLESIEETLKELSEITGLGVKIDFDSLKKNGTIKLQCKNLAEFNFIIKKIKA